MDYQTISRHYIYSYAVLNRVNLSRYSDIPPALGEIDCSILLPSSEHNEELQKNIFNPCIQIMTCIYGTCSYHPF